MNPLMILQALLPLLGSGWQNQQAEQANAANEADQAEALGVSRGNASQLMQQFSQLFSGTTGGSADLMNSLLYGGNSAPATGSLQDVTRTLMGGGTRADAEAAFRGNAPNVPEDLQGYLGRFNSAMDTFNRGSNEINAGFRDRLNTAMGYLDQFGNTAREELGRQYGREDQLATQDAIDSGLYSSTALPTLRAGVQERRGAATRALEEQVATQKANAYRGLSADALNAQLGLLGSGLNLQTGLSGDFLGAQSDAANRGFGLNTQLGLAGLDLSRGFADRDIGLITGYPAVGPAPSNPFDAVSSGLNSYWASRAAQPQQSSNSWWGPAAFQSGSNLAGIGLLGSFLN